MISKNNLNLLLFKGTRSTWRRTSAGIPALESFHRSSWKKKRKVPPGRKENICSNLYRLQDGWLVCDFMGELMREGIGKVNNNWKYGGTRPDSV